MSTTVSVRKRLGVNLFWNTFNTWGSTILTVTSTVLYARLLQPVQWGTYSTLTWMVTNFALLIYLGWNLTINKFVAEAAGKDQLKHGALAFQMVIAYEFFALLILGVVVTLFTPNIALALGNPEIAQAIPLVLFGVLCMVLYTTCNMVLIALQHYKVMSLTSFVSSFMALTAGLTWLSTGGSFFGLVVITATANLINAIVSLVVTSRLLPIWKFHKIDRELFGKMVKYCLTATALMILGQIVYERAEVFFLSNSKAIAQVGYYSLAVAMTNMAISTLPNIVIGPLLAMAAELNGRNDKAGLYQLYSSATRILLIITPPVGIGGALIAYPLIRFMYGEQYTPVAVVAMLLLPPGALMVVTRPANSLLWGLSKQGLTIKSLIPGAILNVTLDAIFIPMYGLYAAAICSTLSQLLTSIFSTYLALNYLKYDFPWSKFIRSTLAALLIVPFGLLPMAVLSGLPLIIVQIGLGIIIYPVGLMLLRVIEPEDIRLLSRLNTKLPGPLQSPFLALLNRLSTRGI